MYFIKANLAINLLAMPMTTSFSGYQSGMFMIFSIGLILYSIKMILNSNYELCKRLKLSQLNYPQVTKYAMLEGPLWMQNCSSFFL